MKSRFAPTRLAMIHVLVKNAQVVAFADQAFDDFDHGTLSQIVRSCFETEAQHADASVFLFHDELHTRGNLHFVARQNRIHDRQFQVVHLGLIGQRPQILGQARTAKRKAGHR